MEWEMTSGNGMEWEYWLCSRTPLLWSCGSALCSWPMNKLAQVPHSSIRSMRTGHDKTNVNLSQNWSDRSFNTLSVAGPAAVLCYPLQLAKAVSAITVWFIVKYAEPSSPSVPRPWVYRQFWMYATVIVLQGHTQQLLLQLLLIVLHGVVDVLFTDHAGSIQPRTGRSRGLGIAAE